MEMMRIYNEWLADFCASKPDRFAGIASIPSPRCGSSLR